MAMQKIAPDQWLISKGDLPAYFLHKLVSGKVAIYDDDQRIATVEVKEGTEPRFLGVLAAMSSDHQHKFSVKTESEVEVDSIYLDRLWSLYLDEVPKEMQAGVQEMVDAILIGDHIKGLRRKLSDTRIIDLELKPGLSSELVDVLNELKTLYESIMHDPECRDPD